MQSLLKGRRRELLARRQLLDVSWLCLWWRSFNVLSNLLLLRYLHDVKDDLLTNKA
jgi:hypothetical protein